MPQLQVKNDIKLFLNGKLSDLEEMRLLKWVKQSPENKMYFYTLQQSLEGEISTRPDEPIQRQWEKLLLRVDPEGQKRKPVLSMYKKYYPHTVSIAAAFLIGFFIAVLFLPKIRIQNNSLITAQKMSAPYGARTQFILPDSSVVWLNSGSELLFPSQFSSTRSVRLSGEAFFKVKKSETPFVVSTGFGEVEVKGTSFNVQAYPDDLFETTLVSGEVLIQIENCDAVILRPGNQAALTENGLLVRPVDTDLFTLWKEGKLIFRNEYLPQLAKRLERWYNVKIEIEEDSCLNDIHYSGTIEMETFSEVLNLLCVTAPVGYTWNEKHRVIKLFYKKK